MLGFGALGEFPLADYGAAPAPVSIALPFVALSLSALVPTARAGKNFDGPTLALLLDSLTPGALTGKHFDAPPAPLTFSAPVSAALAGKNVGLPYVLIEFLAFMPDIQTGRILNLADTFTVVTDGLGALCEGALGEFAIGDGDTFSSTFTRPIRLRMHVTDPAAYAGKNFGPSPVALSLTTRIIEVDARGRPIRINAIAS